MRRLTSILALSLLLVTLAVPATAQAAPSIRYTTITASDGVSLGANVIEPAGPGPHPAIVFVNSWGLNNAEYLAQATQFAEQGYVVLSYTTRGFWDSGGQIDTAGPKDIADVSTVIDWLIANTASDADRIGMGGISYGAGISLIASGFDPRIKAVCAMSGWADLEYSLYGNQTRHGQSTTALALLAQVVGRPSPELNGLVADFLANRDVPELVAFAELRSASTYLDQINANRPAIYLANAFGDSIFPPNQLTDFFTDLTGPKRLELAPGDHATPELTGLLGLSSAIWSNVHRWFDHYLTGADTGIAEEPPVQLTVRGSNAVEHYAAWADVTGTVRSYLPGLNGIGVAGVPTVADAGVALLTNGAESLTGIPPVAWLPAVSRLNAGVWQSPPLAEAVAVRGEPTLRLTVTPSVPTTTAIAYLYDVDGLGTGKLITHVPYTLIGAVPGAPTTVDFDFFSTAYDVAAGHRLAVVVDTVDPLYLDAAPLGSTLTFSPAAGSELGLPTR